MSGEQQRVLVLGGTGMLGHSLFELLAARDELDVHATVRDGAVLEDRLPSERHGSIHAGIDVSRLGSIERVVADVRPAVLINAIGVVPQLRPRSDPLALIQANSVLPHQLARLCARAGIRLVHVSTDCVFSGQRGRYTEDDPADPVDLYGRSKLLGEPGGEALTLRTSTIGHELRSRHGLLEWSLAQVGTMSGWRRAVFSGLPTVELARVVADIVLSHPELAGVYHLSSAPISKFELLRLIARRYGREIDIVPRDEPAIDRSLDSTRFQTATGYRPPSWPHLIDAMFDDASVRYRSRITSSVP